MFPSLFWDLRTKLFIKVPNEIQIILDSKPELHDNISDFWILVYALEKFISIFNTLPLPGTLPDMKSDTKSYVDLQRM